MSIAQWQNLMILLMCNDNYNYCEYDICHSSTDKGGRLTSLLVIPLFQEQRIQSLVSMVRRALACSWDVESCFINAPLRHYLPPISIHCESVEDSLCCEFVQCFGFYYFSSCEHTIMKD